MNKRMHIVPHDGEWAVRVAGTDQLTEGFSTQAKAIEFAVDQAEEEACDVVVHRVNGSFREVIAYETIERRAAAERAEHRREMRRLAYGVVAVGALAALSVLIAKQSSVDVRRLVKSIDRKRPDWLRMES